MASLLEELVELSKQDSGMDAEQFKSYAHLKLKELQEELDNSNVETSG